MPSRLAIGALAALVLGASSQTARAQEPAPTPAPEIAAPSRKEGATTARIVTSTYARRRPGARTGGRRVSTQTAWSGQQTVLLVLESATKDGQQWLNVLLA